MKQLGAGRGVHRSEQRRRSFLEGVVRPQEPLDESLEAHAMAEQTLVVAEIGGELLPQIAHVAADALAHVQLGVREAGVAKYVCASPAGAEGSIHSICVCVCVFAYVSV